MTLIGPGSAARSSAPKHGHDWRRNSALDDPYHVRLGRVAYRCTRCGFVYHLFEGVLPQPDDKISADGRWIDCDEYTALGILQS